MIIRQLSVCIFMRQKCVCVLWQAGGSTGLLMDLAANEKAVHSDFFNGKILISTQLSMPLEQVLGSDYPYT